MEEKFMDILGIILALSLFIFLVFRGWKNYYVGAICFLIVCIFNAMDPIAAFTDSYIAGILQMAGSLFVILFLGTIFGRIYSDTGASIAIAMVLCDKFVEKKKGNARIFGAIIAFFIISCLCIIGGIDCYALFFTLFPIGIILCEKAGIPRRFMPGMLYLNAAFFCAPGVPQIYNIITKTAFASVGYEFDALAAPIPGLIAVVIIAVGSIFCLYYMIRRAVEKGETFEYGPVEQYSIDKERKLPNVIIAVLPLLLVFVLYTICGLDILVALTGGILLTLITMGRYMDRSESQGSFVKTLKLSLNRGVSNFPDALLGVCVPNGLATAITATAAFGTLIGFVGGIDVHPIILVVIVICLIVAITSSPPVALLVGIPLVVGILEAKGISVNVNGIGRVAALAASTFETLPINGAILLTLSLSKVTHKEGYLPEFMESVVFTMAGTVVCAILIIVFPGLS